MYIDRAKFIRTLKRHKTNSIDTNGSRIEQLGQMMQIFLPIKLESTTDEKIDELRISAIKSSRYWIVSLLTTLILPILLNKLFE
jgi:hypothetical protein